MEFWKSNCPIQLLEQHLIASGVIDSKLRGEADSVIADEIAGLFEYAKNSNFPTEIDWQRANTNYSSKPSEYLSTETAPGSYDQYQADARLAPY